jgi:hypothetical protein
MAIAYELSGDERYLDLAQMTFGYYAQSAGTMGKSYGQSLITGSHLIARLHAAGRDDIDTARWEEAVEALVPRVVPPGRKMPVLLRAYGDEPVTADIAIGDLRQTISLQPGDGWRELTLGVPEGPLTGSITCDDRVIEVASERLAEAQSPVGDGVALIAGAEDFLGPALEALGVQFERIADLDDMGRFGTLYLGTQACSLNAAGMRDGPAPLLQWLHSGGTVVVSQPNDTGWDPLLFGAPLIMQEPDGTMGQITATDHTLFAGLDAGALAGAKMYDSVAMAGEAWEVLATDSEGRPAVLELRAGEGRVIVMVPSFERYLTGELPGSQELTAACRQMMQNIIGTAG